MLKHIVGHGILTPDCVTISRFIYRNCSLRLVELTSRMLTQWRVSNLTLVASLNQLQAGLEVDMTTHSITTFLLNTDTILGGFLIVGATVQVKEIDTLVSDKQENIIDL